MKGPVGHQPQANILMTLSSQALKDFKFDRPFQYAPSDPWIRSGLFNAQTKHRGLGYNCDGEECKRNSPYIYWKNHTENDLPARKGWWQRLSQTTAEVKQRIADGNCNQCARKVPCHSCQQQKGGCCSDCQSSNQATIVSNNKSSIPPQKLVVKQPDYSSVTASPLLRFENEDAVEQRRHTPVQPPARTAGLESLDIRHQ